MLAPGSVAWPVLQKGFRGREKAKMSVTLDQHRFYGGHKPSFVVDMSRGVSATHLRSGRTLWRARTAGRVAHWRPEQPRRAGGVHCVEEARPPASRGPSRVPGCEVAARGRGRVSTACLPTSIQAKFLIHLLIFKGGGEPVDHVDH